MPDDRPAPHRPFRAWALQQDLTSLLAPEPVLPDWTLEADHAPVETEGAPGQAFLRQALAPDPEFGLRTKTSVMLWAIAALTVFNFQWGLVDLKIPTWWFAVIATVISLGVVVIALAYPRASPRTFPVIEQVATVLAFALIAGEIAESGGVDSPLGAWLLFPIFYVAVFMPPWRALWNVVLATAIAISPLVYDADAVNAEQLLAWSLLVIVIWALTAVLVYRRRITRGAERLAKFQALGDPLTGVANLRAFELYTATPAATDGELALAMIDMDGMRGANTVFGFDVGDGMIARLADLLLRVSGPEDQVARIGGDEFAVLMPGAGTVGAEAWSQRLRTALEAHNHRVRGELPQLSVAVGTAVLGVDADSIDELREVTDRQLYKAKAAGVAQPHEIDEGVSLDSPRLLRTSLGVEAPDRASDSAEFVTMAGAMWLLAGVTIAVWMLMTNPAGWHRWGAALIVTYCAVVAAVSFSRWPSKHEVFARRASDYSTLALVAPAIWTTGGWQSPMQLVTVLLAAFYAQFLRGGAALTRIAAVIALYSIAFWTSGEVSTAGQAYYLVLVSAVLVITGILFVNERSTDAVLETICDSAVHDPLTGLPNLFAFRRQLEAMLASAERDGEKLSHRPLLVIADLDNFRRVNSRCGHSGGDTVLIGAARRLENSCDASCTVYRIGGDEFAVLCEVESERQASEIAGFSRRALAFTPPDRIDVGQPIAASVGYSLWREGMSVETLVNSVEGVLGIEKAKRAVGDAGDGGVWL